MICSNSNETNLIKRDVVVLGIRMAVELEASNIAIIMCNLTPWVCTE